MKLSKKILIGALSILPLAACSAANTMTDTDTENSSTQTTSTITINPSTQDLDTSFDTAIGETITFNGSSIKADGANLSVNGSTLTISGAGDYLISGTLSDGQIVIAADKEDSVHLFFDGVTLINKDGSPLVVLNADKVVLTLVEGSTNSITDGTTYALTGEEDPDAAIFAKDDLTINGSGALSVKSNAYHGIHGSNEVMILDASVSVTSGQDGIKGKDSVVLMDAQISIDAKEDGVVSSNAVDQGKGFVALDGGSVAITSGLDAIQAETQVLIKDGDLTISAGSLASDDDSGKGIKALLDVSIEGGNLNITSVGDDTLHSNKTITISGGTLTLDAKDDAIHADETLLINGGNITITASYEGLESSEIIINDGLLHINASDDGINTSTGTVEYVKGGPNMTQDDGSTLTINGGSIVLSALGDGVDCNGNITMTGGTLIAFGPTATNNATLDYNQSFTLSGGTILAVGSSGMAQQASSSTINTVLVNLTTTLQSNTLVAIVDSTGKLVVAFETIKSASSIVFASESLANGTYTVYSGGSLSSALSDQMSLNGSYTKGTQLTTFTISSTITSVGSAMGGPGGQIRPGKK